MLIYNNSSISDFIRIYEDTPLQYDDCKLRIKGKVNLHENYTEIIYKFIDKNYSIFNEEYNNYFKNRNYDELQELIKFFANSTIYNIYNAYNSNPNKIINFDDVLLDRDLIKDYKMNMLISPKFKGPLFHYNFKNIPLSIYELPENAKIIEVQTNEVYSNKFPKDGFYRAGSNEMINSFKSDFNQIPSAILNNIFIDLFDTNFDKINDNIRNHWNENKEEFYYSTDKLTILEGLMAYKEDKKEDEEFKEILENAESSYDFI